MLCYVMIREVTKALPHSHGDYSSYDCLGHNILLKSKVHCSATGELSRASQNYALTFYLDARQNSYLSPSADGRHPLYFLGQQ